MRAYEIANARVKLKGDSRVRNVLGKVAWVTGAGTGIGEASAVALAAEGFRIVLSGRREALLSQVAARIRQKNADALILPLDVSDASAVDGACAKLLREFGSIDVLVHSAGMNIKDRSWRTSSSDSFERLMRTNLDGAFHCCHAVLPSMRSQGDGVIVAISSWAGHHPSLVAGPAYSASKHGLNAMIETINMEECVNGIRACALCPGEVATAILDDRPNPPSAKERERMLQPEDIAEIVCFLARLPERVCVNDLLVSPTWNRAYVRSRKKST